MCVCFILPMTTCFVGYPAILVLWAMKRQTAINSALPLPRVKVSVPYAYLNTILTNIFLSLEKIFGMVLSRQSWEIGSPPTGGAGNCLLS